MPERLLRVDDIRLMNSPEGIGSIFSQLGYNVLSTPLSVEELNLPNRSTEAIWDAYLIADQQKGPDSLQVLLFHLKNDVWTTPSTASNRMRSIASSLCRRSSNFLLLGTQNYDQMLLVNPRTSLDSQMNPRVGIRKLLIDRTSPTAYDRDRLDAIAVRNLDPRSLYKAQCEAFDVEKLTKEFYRGYREIFEKVQQVVQDYNPHPYFEDPSRLHQFSQRLLGRIMFLYFLQKKGFLDGNPRFLTHQYQNLRSEPEDTDFYSRVLEPLFFDILNRQRSGHHSPLGKIPYLNGGLFDRDYDGTPDSTGWVTPAEIQLPNALFEPGEGILGFFNRYNFTVAENIQGDEDVAVDPEMLGKVFENMLAADERGQSGTFYTPRGIVQFMCMESLSHYLADESGIDIEVIRQLAEFDPDTPDAEIRKLLTKEQTKQLKRALEAVKVCDPAVGSGAFPMGMMQAILALRQVIARREGMTVERGSLTMGNWKRDIIANNLYGVDIKPEAIEIAKLRMWLSLVVDIPTIDDVEPLPNLDYKLMCGNSLISTIHGEQMIPDPTKTQQRMLNVTPIQAAIQPLLELQEQYFSAEAESRKVLREQIREAEKNVFRVAVADRRQYWQSQQRKLEEDIQRLKGKASTTQVKKQQVIAAKFRELDQIEVDVERGLRSVDFFQWHLHFNDVFEQQGGFDVMIGNPPYVRQEQIKAIKPSLQAEYTCYTGTADLFVYFYERGFQLLKPGGALTYISSNKYMRSGYGEKLRQFLSSRGTIKHLIDFGDAPVFEAIAYPSILLATKTPPADHQIRSLTWNTEHSAADLVPVFRSSSFLMPQKELMADGWRLESPATLRLLEKLRNAGQPLGEYVNGRFYYGIKTGLNEAFVVDRATRDRLIAEHPSSAEVLKPFLRGRDVKRWSAHFAEQYLIRIESSENKQHPWSGKPDRDAERIFAETYPAIYSRFQLFRDGLIKRDDQGKYFWELRSCKYWQEFEQTKVIYPNIWKRNEFTWDKDEYHVNQKAFIIPGASKYLLGVLNSNVYTWYFDKVLAKLQNGFYEPSAIFIRTIPIPQASALDQKAISQLVQKCLDAKGQNVEQWEAEINDRIVHLYGLTQDEIKMISEIEGA